MVDWCSLRDGDVHEGGSAGPVEGPDPVMRRVSRLGAALAVALTVTGLAGAPASARPASEHRAAIASSEVVAALARPAASGCSRHNARPFKPVRARVGSLGGRAVLGVPRVGGLPGTLPLSDADKVKLAWDRPGIRPGFARGHVLMNAHAWPDGSALGNQMNAEITVGALIKVFGKGGRVQCYRVVQHVVRKPSKTLQRLYYGNDRSPPRLAIITCAGVRRGPGDWTKRAVWLARAIS